MTWKILEKPGKSLEKAWNFVGENCWEPCLIKDQKLPLILHKAIDIHSLHESNHDEYV